MGRFDYKHCKGCGRPASEVGTLSHVRLCTACGDERRAANIVHLVSHRGEFFDHWRRRSAAAVGAVLVDDLFPEA